METKRSIKRLDPKVVQRIAAGEVICRPANAVKEMIENSLDAKATSIQVTVRDGGMKYLQIEDNGAGIRKEDLAIVCERFTTSKLEKFEELCSVNTYGFRGEALASISHVAHLCLTTKTSEERCGYRVSYREGKMQDKPVPCGVNQGTVITVENMFYNVPIRHKILKNFHEEFKKVWKVVAHYAIHNSSVGFCLKKYGHKEPNIKTRLNSSIADNISALFNADIARNLMEREDCDATLHLKSHILTTNLNYAASQFNFVLFINHRLVKAEGLQKSITELYNMYLPRGKYPFVYVSLTMAPANVDVNIHPAKETVFYLHEDSVNKKVTAIIRQLILGKHAYKIYQDEALSLSQSESMQCASKKPETVVREREVTKGTEYTVNGDIANFNLEETEKQIPHFDKESASSISPLPSENIKSVADNCLNALNKKDKISNKMIDSVDEQNKIVTGKRHAHIVKLDVLHSESGAVNTSNKKDASHVENVPQPSSTNMQYFLDDSENRCAKSYLSDQSTVNTESSFITLSRILKKAVIDSCDENLKCLLEASSFIKCLDYRHVLIQSSDILLVCELQSFSQEYFYQTMLNELGRFGIMNFSEPIPLQYILNCALPMESSKFEFFYENLMAHGDTLEDSFNIKIDDNGNLRSVPLLLENYYPSKLALPEYIVQLARDVSWDEEEACLHKICLATADFYSKPPSYNSMSLSEWNRLVETILFPAFKQHLCPSATLFSEHATEIFNGHVDCF